MRWTVAAAVAVCIFVATPAWAQVADECAYVDRTDKPLLIDARDILDVPPTPASVAGAADVDVVQHGFTNMATPNQMSRPGFSRDQIRQAEQDACMSGFAALRNVMGRRFRREDLQATAALFEAFDNAVEPTLAQSKNFWRRERPFIHQDAQFRRCIAAVYEHLETSPSYPSGHAAHGWGWALLLAEVFPSRAHDILERGREYGDSRVVCGVHYPSDVEAGRLVAASIVARLHSDQEFRTFLEAARVELAEKFR
jgi:acid phosphatase (class A)